MLEDQHCDLINLNNLTLKSDYKAKSNLGSKLFIKDLDDFERA